MKGAIGPGGEQLLVLFKSGALGPMCDFFETIMTQPSFGLGTNPKREKQSACVLSGLEVFSHAFVNFAFDPFVFSSHFHRCSFELEHENTGV